MTDIKANGRCACCDELPAECSRRDTERALLMAGLPDVPAGAWRCAAVIPEAEADVARGSFRTEFYGPSRCGAVSVRNGDEWACSYGHRESNEQVGQ